MEDDQSTVESSEDAKDTASVQVPEISLEQQFFFAPTLNETTNKDVTRPTPAQTLQSAIDATPLHCPAGNKFRRPSSSNRLSLRFSRGAVNSRRTSQEAESPQQKFTPSAASPHVTAKRIHVFLNSLTDQNPASANC